MIFKSAIPAGAVQQQSAFVGTSFHAGVLTIRPAGPRLGEPEATVIACEVRPLMAEHSRKMRAIVIDLSDVRIMTSYGLGWCIEVRNTGRLISAPTILFGVKGELLDLFRMMKVDRLYTIVQNSVDLARAIAV